MTEFLHVAAHDCRLNGRDLALLIILLEELPSNTYGPVKQSWLARKLGVNHTTVSRALRRLVSLGYLDRKSAGGRRGAYRLCMDATSQSA